MSTQPLALLAPVSWTTFVKGDTLILLPPMGVAGDEQLVTFDRYLPIGGEAIVLDENGDELRIFSHNLAR